MKLCDVNVLVYAHRPDVTEYHFEFATWLSNLAAGQEAFGISEAILRSFVRIVTNRKVFKSPTPTDQAFEFCEELKNRPQAIVLRPGPRNWSIFQKLCLENSITGNLVSDAWHAALAIEYDCTLITTDSDFARFKTLKWQHPLA